MAKERKSNKTSKDQSVLTKAIAASIEQSASKIADTVLNQVRELLKEEISVWAEYHCWRTKPSDEEPMVRVFLKDDYENALYEISLQQLIEESFHSDSNVLMAENEDESPDPEQARKVLKTLQTIASDFERECKETFGEAWESK